MRIDPSLRIKERLLKVIDFYCEGSQKILAEQLNMPTSTINSIVGPRASTPTFKFLCKICLRYTDLNARWLLTGKGEMIDKK